jgi:hypothetical protein
VMILCIWPVRIVSLTNSTSLSLLLRHTRPCSPSS